MSETYRTTRRPSDGGAFFSIEETTTREGVTGAEYVRHVVRHPGGSGVVALADRHAVCVRQYRPAVARVVLEIPAGRPEPGESPHQTARRELFEETGIVADQLDELASFYNAPCFCDGITRLFIATDLTRSDVDVQRGEFTTQVEMVDIDTVDRLVFDGTLVDAKTIIALHLARARVEELR